MSFNFTGTTKKRQVNLGNRSPLRNKISFLQNTQLEREKREKQRIELNNAKVIQSAVRGYLDLKDARINYSTNWNGDNVNEFNFFFKDLILLQDKQLINAQLDQIKDLIDRNPSILNSRVASGLVRTLSYSIEKLVKVKTEDYSIIKKIVDLIDNVAHIQPSTISATSPQIQILIHSLLQVYDQHESLYHILLKFATIETIYEFVVFFTHPNEAFIEYAISKNDIKRLKQLLKIQFTWIVSNRLKFDELSSIEKFNYLINAITIIFEPSLDYITMVDKTFIECLSIIMNGISVGLVFVDDNTDDMDVDLKTSSSSINVSNAWKSKIENLYMTVFPKVMLKQCQLLKIETDLFISFYYALLKFITPRDPKTSSAINMSFKNTLIVNLIVASSSLNFLNIWFEKLCDNEFYNEVLILIEERNYQINENDELWDSAFSIKNESWWRTLYLFQELYSYLLYVSNDSELFNKGRLDQENYISFVSFLKNFSTFIVLGGRSISSSLTEKMVDPLFKNMLQSFQNAGRLSLKLLNQIYLRDLRMKLISEDFWLMKKTVFSSSAIISLLSELDSNHELGSDNDDDENDNYGIVDPTNMNQVDLFSNGMKSVGKTGQMSHILILTYLPFMIPFETRAEIFHALIELDNYKLNYGYSWDRRTKLHGVVSRENILFDAFEAFGDVTGDQFKAPLSVEFLNKFGEKEAGIDGGGLTKELLTSLVDNAFLVSSSNESQNGGLKYFTTTSNYQLYPNPDYFLKLKYQQQNPSLDYFDSEERIFQLQLMRFLGMVIGKCIYEDILIDISFAPFFLSKWSSGNNSTSSRNLLGFKQQQGESQQYRNSFDDLKTFDSELYNNLIKLLKMSEDELDLLDLTFTISEKLPDTNENIVLNLNLIPNGSQIKVTQQNRLQYIYSVAKFKLDQSIATQSTYFLDGLFEIIKPRWLSLFNPYELTKLISGGEKEIDIKDLRNNVVYGGYLNTDQTVIDLFEILEGFDNSEKSKFLKFVTSSSKQPLLGFKELNPKFGIRNSGSDVSRLPTASTCVNLLKLPDYKDKELLKRKLLYSINAEAGFDLS